MLLVKVDDPCITIAVNSKIYSIYHADAWRYRSKHDPALEINRGVVAPDIAGLFLTSFLSAYRHVWFSSKDQEFYTF